MKNRKGILTQVDVQRMEALGKAMQRALSSDDGLVALAQEMVPEITRELGAIRHSLRFARGFLHNAAGIVRAGAKHRKRHERVSDPRWYSGKTRFRQAKCRSTGAPVGASYVLTRS
jgi:hypothetical protein